MSFWIGFAIGVSAGVVGTGAAFVLVEVIDFFRSQAR